MQLGYVHASMHAALILASNRFYSCSVSLNFMTANQFLEVPSTAIAHTSLYPSSVPRVSAHTGHDRSRNPTRNEKSRSNISTGIFEKSCSILPEKSFYTDSKHFTFTKNFPYPLIKIRIGESGRQKEPTGISALLQQAWF